MLCGATQLRPACANCKGKVQFTRDFETFLLALGAKRRSQMSRVCLGYTTKNQWIVMQTCCIWLWLANCSSIRCSGGMVLGMKKVFIMGSITIGEQQKYAELTMDWCSDDYSKRFGDKTVKSNIASGQVVGIKRGKIDAPPPPPNHHPPSQNKNSWSTLEMTKTIVLYLINNPHPHTTMCVDQHSIVDFGHQLIFSPPFAPLPFLIANNINVPQDRHHSI